MTYPKALGIAKTMPGLDERGAAQTPFVGRSGRPGLALYIARVEPHFWTKDVYGANLSSEVERIPLSDEDRAADDWSVEPYFF